MISTNNVAIYCRVATKKQCEPQTLLEQRLCCEQYAGFNQNVYEKYKKAVEESKFKTNI